jgi:hypothetical protein
MYSYGEVDVYAEDTDVLEIPYVKEELGYLSDGYEDEKDEFLRDVERAKTRGTGEATIEERLSLELVEVRS